MRKISTEGELDDWVRKENGKKKEKKIQKMPK